MIYYDIVNFSCRVTVCVRASCLVWDLVYSCTQTPGEETSNRLTIAKRIKF